MFVVVLLPHIIYAEKSSRLPDRTLTRKPMKSRGELLSDGFVFVRLLVKKLTAKFAGFSQHSSPKALLTIAIKIYFNPLRKRHSVSDGFVMSSMKTLNHTANVRLWAKLLSGPRN